MSFCCCQKCGRLADKPYHAITHDCGLSDCPQKLRRQEVEKFFADIPVYQPRSFAQLNAERLALENALNDIERKNGGVE